MEDQEAAIVRDIYVAATESKPMREVLQRVTERARASAAFTFTPFALPHEGRIDEQVGLDPVATQKYLTEGVTTDLWYYALLRRHGALRTGVAYTSQNLTTERELHRSRFYADYLKPMGIGSAAGIIVGDGSSADSPEMPLVVYREPGAAPFGPDALALLQRLQPHLTRALAVRRRLGSAAGSYEKLVFDQLADAAVVVSAHRHILVSNPAAEALFERFGRAVVNAGKLCGDAPAATAALEQGLKTCAGHRPSQEALSALRLAGVPGRGVVARLAPCPARVPRAEAAAAVVFLSEELPRGRELRRVLMSLYRLSAAEAILAEALAQGQTVEGVAEARQVALSTVRTQVRAVFAKTGTSRQTELIRLIGAIA